MAGWPLHTQRCCISEYQLLGGAAVWEAVAFMPRLCGVQEPVVGRCVKQCSGLIQQPGFSYVLS